MQTIITLLGKRFQVEWCAVGTIDGALRFAVVGSDMVSVMNVFINKSETRVLVHVFDEDQKTYSGYMQLKGVSVESDGSILVALAKETV